MISPTLGRWLMEDPIGFDAGDTNLYRFVGNAPVNAIDPSGLEETVPQVSVVPVSAPIVGMFGAFIYPVKFKLDKPTKNGGYIIQEVNLDYKFKDKAGKDVTTNVVTRSSYRYWEAWEVKADKDTPWETSFADSARMVVSGMMDVLEKNGLKDGGAYSDARDALKAIGAKKWDDANDVWWFSGANPAVYTYQTGEVSYHAKVFFVENCNLPAPFARQGGVGFNPELNNNPAGPLYNLSIQFDGGKPTKETQVMIDWLKNNAKATSKIVERKLYASWRSEGAGGFTTLDKSP